jgi:hypothetical protein
MPPPWRSALRRILGRGQAPAADPPAALTPQRLYELTATAGRVLPGDEPITILHHDLGELHLPDGRIVASDPGFSRVPLRRRLPAGRYPVELRVADFAGRDQRTAAAVLRLGPGAPVTWEPAVREDTEGEPSPDLVYGFGVDSGTGCLAGPRALEALEATYAESQPDLGETDPLLARLEETYRHTWSWANVEMAPGDNVVAFSTGWGDGFYAVWWGLDGGGDVMCLLVDMDVLDAGNDPDAAAPGPAAP